MKIPKPSITLALAMIDRWVSRRAVRHGPLLALIQAAVVLTAYPQSGGFYTAELRWYKEAGATNALGSRVYFGQSASGPLGTNDSAITVVAVIARGGSGDALASVSLAWAANAESDLAGYRVRRGDISGTLAELREVGLTTNFTWAGLSPGSTNYFTVTAYNTAAMESGPSNEVAAQAAASQAFTIESISMEPKP